MNKINIIMPFSRLEYKHELIDMLIKLDITLFVIETAESTDWGNHNWINRIISPNIPIGYDPPYFKANYFIQNVEINDNEYYYFMGDDNLIDKNLIDNFKKCDTDVIFCSQYYNPEVTQIINPLDFNTFKIGNCGWYQFCIKGSVLKNIKFEDTIWYADGIMMEYLYKHPNLTKTYLPDVFIKFNGINKKWWER